MNNKSDSTVKWPLIGNNHVLNFLGSSIENKRIANCYIFLGPPDMGKSTIAGYFAQSLLCQEEKKGGIKPCGKCQSCRSWEAWRSGVDNENFSIAHGDFHFLSKELERKNISVEQVRGFIREIGMSSFMSAYKVGIIKDADLLSIEAANALLKTLEEPKEKVVTILIVSNLESLPATIVSRSQVLNFNPVPINEIYDYLLNERKTTRSAAKIFSHLSLGRPALALKLMEDKEFYDDYMLKAESFLKCVSGDLNTRIKYVDNLFGREEDTNKLSSNMIHIWQGVVRDLILVKLDQASRLKNEPLASKLEEVKNIFSLKDLLNILKHFKETEEFLKTNVNPKIIIENLMIQI